MTPDDLRALLQAHNKAVHEAMSPWCNAKTAAAYLGVSVSQIWKMKKAKKLTAYGIDGQSIVRFKRDELDRIMSQWATMADGTSYIVSAFIFSNQIDDNFLTKIP